MKGYMGIFYEEDETEVDEEYRAWFARTVKEISDFNESSRKANIIVGANNEEKSDSNSDSCDFINRRVSR